MEISEPRASTVFLGAIATVLFQKWVLFRALALPSALLLATTLIGQFDVYEYLWLPLLIVDWAIITVFAITTHRIVLLGPGSVPKWGLRRWSSRETYFALHLIVLVTISVVISALLPFVGLVGLLVLVYLFARLSLIFPAAAIDQGVTIASSWALTKRHQLFMILAVAIFPTLFYGPFVFLWSFVPAATARYLWPIGSAVDILLTILITSVLSLAYKEIARFEVGS